MPSGATALPHSIEQSLGDGTSGAAAVGLLRAPFAAGGLDADLIVSEGVFAERDHIVGAVGVGVDTAAVSAQEIGISLGGKDCVSRCWWGGGSF